jgi:hypothetical protein
MCISAYHFTIVLSLLLLCIIILFLHLLSTNHKCTQPCYFLALYKTVAQTVKMDWNSSMRSSRLCVVPVAIYVVFLKSSAALFRMSHLSLYRHYLCNKYTLFMIFSYL